MIIRGTRVGPLLRKTGREILDDNILSLAAATAYYFFFSLFPLFLFIAPLISLIVDKQRVFDWAMQQLATAVPQDALEVVTGPLEGLLFSPSAPGLMSIGVLLAAWTGSNVFNALIDALNRAYDVEETRPFWKKRLVALAAVAASGIFMATASTIMLAGPEIVKLLGRYVGLDATFAAVWMVLQYPVAFTLLVAMMWMIHYFLPNLRQSRKQVLVGAVVAALLWVIVTLAFRLYVVNFGGYNPAYGVVGAVIVLLTWMYLTMLVILVGGELNAELHHGTGRIEPRSGAVYQGRIVTAVEPGRTSDERVARGRPLRARGA